MPPGRDQKSLTNCAQCGASLAHDQRYCLECGARRGALPPHVANLIGASVEQGKPVPVPTPIARPGSPWHPFDAWVRAPRAAAVAVLSMLGFGVLVGGAVGGSVAAPFAPLLVVIAPHSTPSPAPSVLGAGGSGGGGPSGPATITETSPASPPPSSAAAAAGASSSSQSSSTSGGGTTSSTYPPVKHVFMVVLSDQGFNQSFGHSANDPYLATTLVRQGELVQDYYAVAGGPLANEIALISGQGPTPQTVDDCAVYSNITPGRIGSRHQVLGSGCVYPAKTKTLAGQLTAKHLTWKAYVQTGAASAKDTQSACRHPKIGASDATSPSAADPYATWRNPFLYFHSLIRPSCSKEDVGLAQLSKDLKSAATTPSLSYIVADVCDDGSDTPCGPGQKSGLAAADAFLKSVVPEIKRSPAYKSGLIAITFDDAPQTGPNADQSSCCDNPTYPNLAGTSTTPSTTGTGTTTTAPSTTTTATTAPTTGTSATTTTGGTDTTTTVTTTITTTTTTTVPATTAPTATTGTTTTGTTTTGTTTTGTTTTGTTTTGTTTTSPASLGTGETNPTGGGGQVGLLLLSPYVKANSTDVIDYFNHFSLLASIDDLFGLKPLGYAADPSLPVFGSSVYNNYGG